MKRRILLSIGLVVASCYSTNAQNFAWVKSIGGLYSDNSTAITLDASGNIYTTGTFLGTVDFDPGAGVSNLTSASLSNAIFIQKLDASGNFVWAKQISGVASATATTSNCNSYSIAVDGTGNVFITGTFTGTVDFDPGAAVYNIAYTGVDATTNRDIFIEKLDASGNFVWVQQIGAPSAGGLIGAAYCIIVDAVGNSYTTGSYSHYADFDPGTGVASYTSAGRDVYIEKLDAAGNFVWVKTFTGSGSHYGTGLALDGSGNIFIGGAFQSTVDFDPGVATYNLTSAGNSDIFIAKLDASGNFGWAKKIGGTADESLSSIKLDIGGNIFYTGSFGSTVDFDPGTGTANLTATGSRDVCIGKLDASGNYGWAKRIGGTGTSANIGRAIHLDNSGNVYIAGSFSNTVDFDPGTGVSSATALGMDDVFIEELSSSGSFVWARQIGSTNQDGCSGIAVNGSGEVYTVGTFAGSADFDPGPGTFNISAVSSWDAFIEKLSPPVTLTASMLATSTTVCEDSCIIFTSTSTSSVILDSITWSMPGLTVSGIHSPSSTACFPSAGSFTMHLYIYSGIHSDSATQIITVDPAPHPVITRVGNVLSVPALYTGYQWYNSTTAIAGATNNSYTYTTPGIYSVVVDSAGCKGTSAISSTLSIDATIAQRPLSLSQISSSQLMLSAPRPQGYAVINIFDANGRQYIREEWDAADKTKIINCGNLVSGMYLIKINSVDGVLALKWMKTE